jgi:cytoskeletal protein RodZ
MTARLGQLLEFTGKKDQGQEPEFEPREPMARRQSLGEVLRQTRERYRQDLETVSAELRIRLVYLRAIEDDRFDLLPGPTYASGFLRSYAEYLGLNSKDVIRRYREEMAQVNAPEEPEEVEEVVEPRRAASGTSKRPYVLAAALAVAVGFAGWVYGSGADGGLLQTVADLPARIQAMIASPVPEAEPAPAPVETTEPTAVAEAPQAEQPAPAAPVEPAPSEPTDTAAAAALPAEEPVEENPAALAAANGLPMPPTKPTSFVMPTEPEEGEVEVAANVPAAPAEPTPQPPAQQPAAESAPPPAPAVAEAPQAPAPAPTPPAPPAPSVSSAAAAVPAAPAAPAPEPTTPTAASTSNLNALAAIPSVPPDALNQSRSQTFGATNAGSRVLLYARLESWIQVTDAENVPLWTRVLRAGDSYLLPDQPGLTLATGNAGGLDIFVDGKKVPTLGPVGVERRGVTLDPEQLKTGAP